MFDKSEKFEENGIVTYVFKGVLPKKMHDNLRAYSKTLVNGAFNNGNVKDGIHVSLKFSQWKNDYKVGLVVTDLTKHPEWESFIS